MTSVIFRLFAGIAALVLAGAPATACTPSTPCDFDAIAGILKSVGVEGQQLDQLVQTYQQVVNVYQTSTKIWNSVSEVVGADRWVPEMAGLRNALPFAASDHAGWVGGFNDPAGLPYGSTYVTQNTVGGNSNIFADGSFVGGELLKGIWSLSSMQAVANNSIFTIERRINALNDLFNQLSSIATVQQTDSLSARLNNELNYANSQQTQAQSVLATAQLQIAAQENAQRQWQYMDETLGITNACKSVAAAGGNVQVAACGGVTQGNGG